MRLKEKDLQTMRDLLSKENNKHQQLSASIEQLKSEIFEVNLSRSEL